MSKTSAIEEALRTVDREQLASLLREARANAFEEAAEVVLNAKWQKGSMNYNQGFISGELKAKADRIRKGEEE